MSSFIYLFTHLFTQTFIEFILQATDCAKYQILEQIELPDIILISNKPQVIFQYKHVPYLRCTF